MALLLKKNSAEFPTMLSELLDSEKYSGKNFLNMDQDNFPYNSMLKIPSANILERNKDYVIELAAPGLEKKDFRVEVENDVLSISAHKERRREKTEDGISRKEFSFEDFCRTFRLPENTKIDKVQANYENGILRIEIPKKTVSVLKPKKEIKVI